MSAPTPFVLCADDFGISPAVNEGIAEAVAAGRLSAVACMTALPAFADDAGALKPHRDKVDVGVHITLTDQEPAGSMAAFAPDGKLPPFNKVLLKALGGALPVAEIGAEIDRQVDRFRDAFGELPDFIDGHQHIHQLPGIRDVVLAVAEKHRAEKAIYVRNCTDTFAAVRARGVAVPAAYAIAMFGRPLSRALARRGLPTNDGFAGHYDFTKGLAFAEIFPKFLRALRANGLIYCHPGRVDEELRRRDPFTTPREHELAYLLGGKFPDALTAANAAVSRFKRPSSAAPSPPA